MIAGIYARFSTDKQSEASTLDQIRLCTKRAEALGAAVGPIHTDEAISGSTPVESRPGGRALLADALAGRFTILVLEGLDRLSRDMVEQERLVRRLEHRGIRILGVADGYDSQGQGRKIQRTMRGLINEIYLDDLRHKTHRGLEGKVADGYHAGGRAFGYTTVFDGKGHTLAIDEHQAAIVRQIFTWFGQELWSVERIVYHLNETRVPAPRGKLWAKSAVYGSPKQGTGILNNALYRGQYTWNRGQWVKDPDTGKRTRLQRPESEWMTSDRPELRIVSDELWQAAYKRLHRYQAGGPRQRPGKPTYLGGILRCGICGGPMNAVDVRRYGCKNNKESGPTACAGTKIARKTADDRILGVVRAELLSPDAITEFQKAWKSISSTMASQKKQQNQSAAKRLGELEREIDNLVQAIATVGMSVALQARLAQAEAEKSSLLARSPEAGQDHAPAPFNGAKIKAAVLALEQHLAKDPQRSRELLAELLGDITVRQTSDGIFAELNEPRPRLLLAAGALLDVVAGAGFIPQKRTIRLA